MAMGLGTRLVEPKDLGQNEMVIKQVGKRGSKRADERDILFIVFNNFNS